MNYSDDYKIDTESFPSFFAQYKEFSLQSIKEDSNSIDNEMISEDLKSKVRTLEFEKKRLEIDIEAASHRASREIQTLEDYAKEMKEKERRSQIEMNKVKEESAKFQMKCKELEEKMTFLDSQVEFLTKENGRVAGQYRLDKENWELQLGNSKKAKTDNKENSKSVFLLAKAEQKIAELAIEVSDLKAKNENQRLNYQKKIGFVETEIKKLKSEEEKYIKELEVKNRDSEEIIVQLKSRIKEIEKMMDLKKVQPQKTPKKVVESLSKLPEKAAKKSQSISEKLSKSSKSPLVQSPKAKRVKVPLPAKRSISNLKESSSTKEIKRRTPSRDSSIDKGPSVQTTRIHNKAPSYLRKENQSAMIETTEKDIAVLTGRYKYLLQMSQDASDLQSLRSEISKVAGEIEEKSNYLFMLKKKQQDYLKQQIKP